MKPSSSSATAGARLLGEGKVQDAARQFESGLSKDQDDLECLMGLARIHLATNDTERARSLLKKLIELVPGHPEANSHLLRLDAEGGDALALTKLRALSKRTGATFFEHLNLGRALLSRKEFAAAASALVLAGRLQPKSAHVHWYLGLALEAQGQLGAAVRVFRSAVELAPTEHAPLVGTARVLARLGHHAKALEGFERASALAPREPSIYPDIARLSIKLGDLPRALKAVKALRKLEKKSAEGAYLEGLISLLSGKGLAADKHLTEARKLAPGSLEPLIALARVKSMLHDDAAAEQILEDALKRFPADAGPAKDLTVLWLRQPGKPKQAQARTVLAAAAKKHPDDLELQLNLALAWADQDKARARKHAQSAAASKSPDVSGQAQKLIAALG